MLKNIFSNFRSVFKDISRDITPPILWRGARKIRKILKDETKNLPEWEYIPDGWEYAKTHPEVKGWNVPSVAEAYVSRWSEFVKSLQGSQPLGGANPTLSSHNTFVSFAYAITFASRNKSKIRILDWGGGMGHYYLIARAVLPKDVEIVYTCKDLPLLCEYGRRLLPEATFYDDDSYLRKRYDFSLISASLQYAVEWKETLRAIAGVTDEYLFVTRLPVILGSDPSFVVLQRAYSYGYGTEYLGWVFNRKEFLEFASGIKLELIREFLISWKIDIYRAPAPCDSRGFLFRVAHSAAGEKTYA